MICGMNTENAPNQPQAPAPVGTMPVPAEPAVTNSSLTPKQELYCVTLIETGNRGLAYRRAYNVGVNTKPATVWRECVTLENNPALIKRLNELRDQAAANATVSKTRLIQFLWDRIMADRRDVINHVRRCCRHCWGGERHLYQWKDEMEFVMASAEVLAFNQHFPEGDDPRRKPEPTDEGGYGFDAHREPNPTCDSEQCMGDGMGKTVISDTTQLSGAAALIYEGVKETAQGIEIKLADRNADMAQLAKLLGWSIDKVDATVKGNKELPPDMYDIPSTASPEDASRRYLALVSAQ